MIALDDLSLFPPPGHKTLRAGEDLVLKIPVKDANLQDALTLRVFVDFVPVYTQLTPLSGDLVRTLFGPLSAPCSPYVGRAVLLEAVVSDRGFKSDDHERPDDAEMDAITWELDCVPP